MISTQRRMGLKSNHVFFVIGANSQNSYGRHMEKFPKLVLQCSGVWMQRWICAKSSACCPGSALALLCVVVAAVVVVVRVGAGVGGASVEVARYAFR